AVAPVLVVDDRPHTGPHGSHPCELKERFQFLERITCDSRSQGLAKNAVEIDEYFSPKQIVDFRLPCCIQAHQLFDRGVLVGAEVVHMEVGITREPGMHEIDEMFEGATLSGVIVRPERLILRRSSVDRENAEQKREPAGGLEKRMSFEVEDQVASGALR